MDEHIKITLEKIYFDPANTAGFSSAEKLYKEAKADNVRISMKDVRTFLKSVEAYTMHKRTKRKFQRQSYLVNGPGVILGADTGFLVDLANSNDNYKYFGLFIDLFSHYMTVFPLKTKKGEETAQKINNILSTTHHRYSKLFSDSGSEFINAHVKKVLNKYNMTQYTVYNSDIKCGIAEVSIKNLKARIYKVLTHTNSDRYLEALPQLVNSYNDTPCSYLMGKSPSHVHFNMDIESIRDLKLKIYKRMSNLKKVTRCPLQVGQYVRVTTTARTQFNFVKYYKGLNTIEIFQISRIIKTSVPITYYLRDLNLQPILGKFYKEELIPVSLPKQYKIKILKTIKNKKGQKRFLVNWLGYPQSFDSYITEKDIA